MLIFTAQALAFVAVPKTGTTALEQALKPHADIVFRKKHKHATAMRFHRKIRPFLKDAYKVEVQSFAVMREPEDQIRSWYKYRCREELIGQPEYAGALSFDAFVEGVLAETPPPFAQIGSQIAMLTGRGGRLLIDTLLAYEDWDQIEAFLSDRLNRRIVCARSNVSPATPAPLDPALRARLRAHRAAEFALYDRLIASGGKLQRKA